MTRLSLYTYWRSSCSYRVRIALNLKGLEFDSVPVHLVRDGGGQHSDDYRRLNPQGLVPTLLDDGQAITQSLAIIEYLEELHPEPALLPMDARQRARVRGMAYLVACEMQPMNNLGILQFLKRKMGSEQADIDRWYRHFVDRGFTALEHILSDSPATYCHGDAPGLADICLVPQVYNAERFGCALDSYPNITRINELCLSHKAFANAIPEAQPDAE